MWEEEGMKRLNIFGALFEAGIIVKLLLKEINFKWQM